ncbi:MAG: MazG nucleotide pyrophosphohydrolase domain-containing protein, partial [Steroidobacteraceae bacterium]
MNDDAPVSRLIRIMRALRDPQTGCPWDREQTMASIVPHTLEEAYEVAEAVDEQNPNALRDELGDLLFQVVFLAALADEAGWFNFN